MPDNDKKFLKYKARILAINGGNIPDVLTSSITVPDFRGYQAGDVIPAGTKLSDIINKEFKSTPVTYTITITSIGAGTVTPSGTQTVNRGANLTVTATPDAGNVLGTFTVDGNPVSNPYTFTNIQANHNVHIEFNAIPTVVHTITATAGANGTINPSGAVLVDDGASKNFIITANSGYQVKDVKVDSASVGAVGSYQFDNVVADHTIAAEFEEITAETYTVNVTNNTPSFGTITPASGTVSVGTITTVTATPNSGYKVKTLTLDGVDKTSPFTIDGVKDQTYNVVVEFEQIPTGKLYTLLTGVKPAATEITSDFAEEDFDDTVTTMDFHVRGGSSLGTKASIAYPASKGNLSGVTFDAWEGGIPDAGYLSSCTVTDVTYNGVAYKFLTTAGLAKNANIRLTFRW